MCCLTPQLLPFCAAAIVPFRTLSLTGNPLSADAKSKELPQLQKLVVNLVAN
jgi:hypothetical protein